MFLVGSFSQELNWKFKATGFLLGAFLLVVKSNRFLLLGVSHKSLIGS